MGIFYFHCVALVFSYSAWHIAVCSSQKSVNEWKGDKTILVGESQPKEIVLTYLGTGKPLKVFDYGMKKLLDNTDF